MAVSVSALVEEFESVRSRFGPDAAATKAALLDRLERRAVGDPETLERLHECLCFVRAYPDDAGVLDRAERMLARQIALIGREFGVRVDLRIEADVSSPGSPSTSRAVESRDSGGLRFVLDPRGDSGSIETSRALDDRMCDSSAARTASSSTRLRSASSPVVTTTFASSGLRLSASALATGLSTTQSLGSGMRISSQSPSTRFW